MDEPLGQRDIHAVNKALSALSPDQMQSLGLGLGLSLQRIQGYNFTALNQLRPTLIANWINKVDFVEKNGGATWNSLLTHLRDDGQNGIADNLELELTTPPHITKSPSDMYFVPGKDATLSVSASGCYLKYQWQKRSSDIVGANSQNYTIRGTTVSSEGEYRCVVSNYVGKVTSEFGRLALLKPPALVSSPASMTNVVPGRQVTLSVSASGLFLKYQWKRNETTILQATSKKYMIPQVSLDDEGEYQCNISNDAGKVTSQVATLTVLKRPVITKSPTNVTNIVTGTKASLSISASGDNINYQWIKDGKNIPDAKSSTYTILKTTADDEGEYHCIVSNDAGKVTSDAAQLTLLRPPVINKSPTDMINVVPGQKATMSISASGVKCKYQWQKNGVNISGANSSTYSIPKVKDDEGEYQCVVNNDAGEETSASARLTVLKPPVILRPPVDCINVVPGKETKLSISDEGFYTKYQWKRNEIAIPGATSKIYLISKISLDDEGGYQCVVSNDAGEVTSRVANVTVLKPPVIIDSPTDHTNVIPGEVITLSVSASGFFCKYQWIKNGRKIPKANSCTYSILKTAADDEGEYKCVVSNDAGRQTSDVAKLTVLKVPTVTLNPSNISLAMVGRQVTLSITASGCDIKHQWLKNGAKISDATSCMYIIKGAKVEDEGEYQCVVSNEAGSATSATVQILILEAPVIVSSPDSSVVVTSGSRVDLSVTARGYLLKYQWKRDLQSIQGATSSTYTIVKTTDKDYGEYQCLVSNDAGKVLSDATRLIMLKPPEITKQPKDVQGAVPGRPVALSITASGQDIKYQWRKNGKDIPGANSRRFIVFDVTEDDAGEYQCSVSNSAGDEESEKAKLTVCLELQVSYILCHHDLFSGNVEEKVVTRIHQGPEQTLMHLSVSTTMKDLYDHICTKEEVKDDFTIELYSHEGYPLNANLHTLTCTLKQWKVSNNDLFYVFIRRVEQSPVYTLNDSEPEGQIVDHTNGNDELHIMSSLFGSFTIKADLYADNANDIITRQVASAVEMPPKYICLFTRNGKRLDESRIANRDVFTLVLRNPCELSGPQGEEYGKLTYNFMVPQTDRGVSKFFSTLKFICSKKRDEGDKSRLLSYLLHLTSCPPMVHALKLLCENSKLSLPCWVALIEGCYQLFRSFMSRFSVDYIDGDGDDIFNFSDYFWGLIISKSQKRETIDNIYAKQTLVCTRSKLKMSFPVTVPGCDDVLDYQSVEEDEDMEFNTCVLRMLVYHPWESDSTVHVLKGKLPRSIPPIGMPCELNDLKTGLVFLPIVPPTYISGECLTFIPRGHLAYYNDDDVDRKVYYPVGCKTVDIDRRRSAFWKNAYELVVSASKATTEGSPEPNEAIVVLVDNSSCMKKPFDSGKSRMQVAKEFLDAFAMTCLIYKLHPLMAVYTFGDKDNKVYDLKELKESTVKNLKEKLETIQCRSEVTAFYQAIERAKDKLRRNTRSDCGRRILCIGSSDHNRDKLFNRKFDINGIVNELKGKLKIVVDAIELADTPEGSLRTLAEATEYLPPCSEELYPLS